MRVVGEHEAYCCGARVRISPKGIEVLSEPRLSIVPYTKPCMQLNTLMQKLFARPCR